MQQQFFSSPEDCEWLRSTHLGGRKDLMFGSFILIGNEDCPTAVHLYPDPWPLISDEPHVIKFL